MKCTCTAWHPDHECPVDHWTEEVPKVLKPKARFRVCLATPEEHQGRGFGGRERTLHNITLQQFATRFGDPHATFTPENSDGKVTAEWYFMTPRGLVSVYDYWWNPPGILSIGNRTGQRGAPRGNHKAMLWARRYFRECGLEVS